MQKSLEPQWEEPWEIHKNPQETSPNKRSRHLWNSRMTNQGSSLEQIKGTAIVIMDKDYQEKAKALLEDQGTYKALKSDPTSRIKTKLTSLLKKIKSEGGIEDTQYKKMYPTGAVPPKFMAYLKYIKEASHWDL